MFVILVAFIACGVYGYAVNQIGSIIREINFKGENIKNLLALMNSHMKRHNINNNLKLKVRKYYEFYYNKYNEQDE